MDSTQNGVRIYLDISRLLTAGRRRTPSGIERVELAYAKRFGSADGTRFVAGFCGGLHLLPYHFASAYIATLDYGWSGVGRAGHLKSIAGMAGMYLILLAQSVRALITRRVWSRVDNSVYLNLSHENLTSPDAIAKFRQQSGARLVFFVHDLIPITHPEYTRPGQARLHRQRMDTVAALADAVLVNSAATRDAFFDNLIDQQRRPVHVLRLGIPPAFLATGAPSDDRSVGIPYFLILATIEPRKNHLLLLNLWRVLAAEGDAPRLMIAGRRGWENEQVLDMLDRCEAITDLVEERRQLRDDEIVRLIQGARAVLLPSFAEGYGLPVAEALGLGTPVICSDLPALREIGGGVPEYLDPLDGLAWRQTILDYAQPASPRRQMQCERMRGWAAPRWENHFEQVTVILENLVKPGRTEG